MLFRFWQSQDLDKLPIVELGILRVLFLVFLLTENTEELSKIQTEYYHQKKGSGFIVFFVLKVFVSTLFRQVCDVKKTLKRRQKLRLVPTRR